MTNEDYRERPQGIGEGIWHYAVNPILLLFASDTLSMFRRVRALISSLVAISGLLVLMALFLQPAKFINAAGITLDIAGALRLFILDRILDATKPFWNKDEYPHGPPSIVMRELVMPEATLYADTRANHESRFYYTNRGVLLLVLGFVLQLIATAIA